LESEIGKVSPRAFSNCELRTGGDGGYFGSSVLNSFPDLLNRVDFLNTFYQCFLFGQLPHKTRKLVVVGEKDSGKSSWARIFFGMMPKSKIAVLTKEKTFGASLIKDDTQLIYIDEWCKETVDADLGKTLFQGGIFAQAMKHRAPSMQDNQAGTLTIYLPYLIYI